MKRRDHFRVDVPPPRTPDVQRFGAVERWIDNGRRMAEAWRKRIGARQPIVNSLDSSLLAAAIAEKYGTQYFHISKSVNYALEFLHLLAARDGFPLFRLTPDLAAALVLTDPAPQGSPTRLPFDSFAVLLPVNDAMFLVLASHFWACDATHVPTSPDLRQRMLNGELRASEMPEAERWFAIAIGEVALDAEALVFTCRAPRDDENRQSWIAAALNDPEFKATDDLHTRGYTMRALRLLLNFLDYVASIAPSVGRRATRRETAIEFRGLPEMPRAWVVGESIHLPNALRAAAVAEGDYTTAPAWKLHARYVVRGHWRNQACGPGLQDHRLTWIQPYWKGPANLDEALMRTFDVGTNVKGSALHQ